MKFHWLACLPLLLLAATSAQASHFDREIDYTGILHNDKDDRRTTLELDGRIYELDFQGVNLFREAERHDRKRARVIGRLSEYTYDRPVIIVDRITFNPYGNSVTYNISESHSRTYRDYDRYDDDDYYRRETGYYYDDGYRYDSSYRPYRKRTLLQRMFRD
jgi:hypothetical protein